MPRPRRRAIPSKIMKAYAPSKPITVSDWADQNRILPHGYPTPEPGPWRTARVPYLRDIMDTFSDPFIERIVLCKGSQLGGTEAIYNMLLWAIAEDPSPTILVMPTEKLAISISRLRIQPSIEAIESLRNKKPKDADEFTVMEMKFEGMSLTLVGSNSPANLASRPARFLFLDEVDKYDRSRGKEADAISLAAERQKTFWNRKTVIISTPTLEDGQVWRELNNCDVIKDYWVPCPRCGASQTLKFDHIQWSKYLPNINHDDPNYPIMARNVATYECDICHGEITNIERSKLIANGEWRPREKPAGQVKSVGFHISTLYSPWQTWGDIAEAFLKAKDWPEKLQNVVNSWWALPWIDRVTYKRSDEVLSHCVEIGPQKVPVDTIALTCGIDPGQKGFWFVVLAWRPRNVVHLVHYDFLSGWENLRELLLNTGYPTEDGKSLFHIWRAGIDTGGSGYEGEEETMTEGAYNFLRGLGTRHIFGTKGKSYRSGKRLDLMIVDKMPGKAGQPIPGGISVWHIDTDSFKDSLHYRLQQNPNDMGSVTLHVDTDEEFSKQILAEEKRRNQKGEYEWVKVYRRNHYLDAMVIALAMGDPEAWGGVSLLSKPVSRPAAVPDAPKEESMAVRKEPGWFGGQSKKFPGFGFRK